jgi:hypothetical protein
MSCVLSDTGSRIETVARPYRAKPPTPTTREESSAENVRYRLSGHGAVGVLSLELAESAHRNKRLGAIACFHLDHLSASWASWFVQHVDRESDVR